MHRIQLNQIVKDLKEKYLFLGGPRQSGKTTLAKSLVPQENYSYLSYDRDEDRQIILKKQWPRNTALVIFDEFHKFPTWKTFLKGIYDTEGVHPPILVTGSAKLNVFKKGNDSMVGRYYYHRLLPLSVKEVVVVTGVTPSLALDNLLAFGNFPEPFLKASADESKRWRNLYFDKIIREDVTDLSNVKMIPKLTLLIDLLRERVGNPVSYKSLSEDLQVAPQTVKEWIDLLEQLYVVFRVTPYHKNIARSLLKEPKIYFFDITMAFKPENHLENLVALCLLKHLWFLEDTKGVKAALHYLRTKDKRELDFVTVEDRKVTRIIEVKTSDESVSPAFKHFNKFIPEAKQLQLVRNLYQRKTVNSVEVEKMSDFLANLDV